MTQPNFLRVLIRDKRIPIEYKKVEWWTLWDPKPDLFYVPETTLYNPASRCIMRGFLFEELTHKLVNHICTKIPGKDVLHAGAYFGDMLPSFSKANPEGKIFAFEPVMENYYLSNLSTQENDLSNVVLFHGALRDEVGSILVNTDLSQQDVDSEGNISGGLQLAADGARTNSYTVDMFDFENIVLMQLDVEGHERSALLGARRTIHKYKPIIVIEDYNVVETKDILEEHDYHLAGMMSDKHFVWVSKKMPEHIELIKEFFTVESLDYNE